METQNLSRRTSSAMEEQLLVSPSRIWICHGGRLRSSDGHGSVAESYQDPLRRLQVWITGRTERGRDRQDIQNVGWLQIGSDKQTYSSRVSQLVEAKLQVGSGRVLVFQL